MSCEYLRNSTRGSTHGACASPTSGMSSGRGGRAYHAPPTPNQQHQYQPQNFGQGFTPYANPPMGGGYEHASPPTYYAGGYSQGPAYASFGGSQNQPLMQPGSMGWGKCNVFVPPMGQNQLGPSRRNDEAMDVDKSAPSQWGQTHKVCIRHPRRKEPWCPPQPA